MTTETPLSVIQFWRDEVGEARWYVADPALDKQIRDRFERLWRDARDGKLNEWQMTPDGTLALLVVLDQFPRNMFRGTAQAFATDAQALAIAKTAVAREIDLRVPTCLRQFFFTPFMHSENLADQDRCIALFEQREGPDAYNLPYARAHRAEIAKFGRFPSRNPALGRTSTPEETAHMNASRISR